MSDEIIFRVAKSPEGGFEARALGHSVYTEAGSMDEPRERARDAVTVHFEDAERPCVIRTCGAREEVFAARPQRSHSGPTAPSPGPRFSTMVAGARGASA